MHFPKFILQNFTDWRPSPVSVKSAEDVSKLILSLQQVGVIGRGGTFVSVRGPTGKWLLKDVVVFDHRASWGEKCHGQNPSSHLLGPNHFPRLYLGRTPPSMVCLSGSGPWPYLKVW